MLEVAEAYGLTFRFPAADTAIGPCLRDYGEFARPEIDLIETLCDGDLVDVGANIGAICLPFAHGHPGRVVVAIEAQPALAEILQANVTANGLCNVSVLSAAAGEASGTLQIPLAKLDQAINVGASSLYMESAATGLAQMIRLDDAAPANTRFVKIDVEGFEPRVLQGAPYLLRDVRPAWLVEVSRSRLRAAEEVKLRLSDAGYDLYWFYSPFLTRKRPRRLDERPKLRGDISILAIDGNAPWPLPKVGQQWPTDVGDFPYLAEYGLVSGRRQA